MSECNRCKKRGQTWSGSAPQCAFRQGVFEPENWNCATANALRAICEAARPGYDWQTKKYSPSPLFAQALTHSMDEQSYSVIMLYGYETDTALTLWVSWYKHRGCTEEMWLFADDEQPRKPTLAECETIIAHYEKHYPHVFEDA